MSGRFQGAGSDNQNLAGHCNGTITNGFIVACACRNYISHVFGKGLAMIAIRRANERGYTNLGWLDSRHTFSFGDYFDANHMGFGSLRVINDDRVKAGKGFAPHSHKDMEIISFVLKGALEHKDSLGNGSIILSGEAQRMTAGTGIQHSEFNPSTTEDVRFLQIWILPKETGVPPSYEQKQFGDDINGRLRLVAAADARDGSLKVHQDVDVFAAVIQKGQTVSHALTSSRKAWVQVAIGSVLLNGLALEVGDGAAISDETIIRIDAVSPAEILLFDMV
jgi:quercetin 2,3-dioxygenase